MNRSLKVSLFLAAVLASSGCGSESNPGFDHLEFSQISLAPNVAQLGEHITLAEGVAVKAVVHAVDTKGRKLAPLELASQDPRVMGVEYGPEPDSFVFYGTGVGQTLVAVVVSGKRLGVVDAEVISQDH